MPEDFNSEIENFFKSLEDGTFWDGISQEVWDLADKIVKENPDIAKNL